MYVRKKTPHRLIQELSIQEPKYERHETVVGIFQWCSDCNAMVLQTMVVSVPKHGHLKVRWC
jgi:hypothetical protein